MTQGDAYIYVHVDRDPLISTNVQIHTCTVHLLQNLGWTSNHKSICIYRNIHVCLAQATHKCTHTYTKTHAQR